MMENVGQTDTLLQRVYDVMLDRLTQDHGVISDEAAIGGMFWQDLNN
jgi:hypothetical protein